MELSKDEIAEELTSLKEIMRGLRRRRRGLQQKQAIQGLNAPVEVFTEIEDVSEQMRAYEAEIKQLATRAAENQLSPAEVEYQVLLAEALDTPSGRPTVTSATQLELARLSLGLLPERARELERAIRAALVEETFNNIKADTLQYLPRRIEVPSNSPGKLLTPDLQHIGRAIRLDPSTTIELLLTRLEPDQTIPLEKLGAVLIHANNISPRSHEYILFEQFLADLSAALASRSATNDDRQ